MLHAILSGLGVLVVAAAALGLLRFGYRITMSRHDEEAFDDWINRQY